MTVYTTIDSPLGELLLVGEESATAQGGTALASVSVPDQKRGAVVEDGWRHDPAAFARIAGQLRAYFDGTLTVFDIEHTTRGTDFQQRVWKALEEIPYGATTSYGALAASIGAPRAAVRAVGTAIGANPLLVVRPCHRVIGADGSMAGYAGGLEHKRTLLRLEGTDPADERAVVAHAAGERLEGMHPVEERAVAGRPTEERPSAGRSVEAAS